jgi:UDP-N-acetyl-D-glucosamine dehydrogenase
MKTLNYRARFIELAGEINANMPHYVVSKVIDGLNEFGRSAKGSNVLVLGVAYKPEIDDPRESPALDVIELLRQRGVSVTYSDPYIPILDLFGDTLMSKPLTADLLAASDCVVIVTNHRAFDYHLVVRYARLIVDTRNALRGIPHDETVVVPL